MIQRIQKWFAIRSYAKNLGSKLRKRYGASRHYTPEQVKATIREYGFNLNWACYALCMYCDCGSFNQYHIDIGETCDYGAMQSEVAAQFFHNHASFNEVDVSVVIDNTISWNDSGSYGAGDICGAGGFDGGDSCDSGGGD